MGMGTGMGMSMGMGMLFGGVRRTVQVKSSE